MSFTILGPDGSPVTEYDVEHEKELHLIAVRRDFSGFQHVHPERAEDGTWSVPLAVTAGQWRLFADFKASGAEAVTLDGDLVSGEEARLTLSVTRDGVPVVSHDDHKRITQWRPAPPRAPPQAPRPRW